MKKVRDSCQCERYLKMGYSFSNPAKRLAIRYKSTGAEFSRQLYESGGRSPEWKHIDGVEVSPDLATLIVLFAGSLVPAGILADKITEEKPELEWVAEFLREWDTLEGTV